MLSSIRFKSRDVEALEKKFGCSFSELFEPTIGNLVTLIKCGLGCDEDKAYEILDAELEKDDNDITSVMFTLMERAQFCGFFPRKVNLKNLRNQMETQILQANNAMMMVEPEESKFKDING